MVRHVSSNTGNWIIGARLELTGHISGVEVGEPRRDVEISLSEATARRGKSDSHHSCKGQNNKNQSTEAHVKQSCSQPRLASVHPRRQNIALLE